MSSRITPEMKYIIAECESLIKTAQAKNRIDLIGNIQNLISMTYSGKVSNSEIKKCINAIGCELWSK